MYILIAVLAAVISSVSTWLVAKSYFKGKLVGALRIDRSDPDEDPYLFAEITKGIGDISRFQFVTFEVIDKSYLPQN